jgi:hypothetical protein
MAFKPFDFFRKRQKVFIALLGVLCIFIFVIADAINQQQNTGAGIGTRLRRLFFGSETQVAEVGGRSLEKEDLAALSNLRRDAIRLLDQLENRPFLIHGFTPEEVPLVRLVQSPFFQLEMQRIKDPEFLKQIQAIQAKLSQVRERNKDFDRMLGEAQNTLVNQSVQTNPRPDDAAALVEYLFWVKAADELGIVFTPTRVMDDLRRMAGGNLEDEDLYRVLADAKVQRTPDELIACLADEVRVMIARGLVLGTGGRGADAMGGQVTPLDLWDAYVRVKTKLNVGILSIPVNSQEFLPTGEPPETELRELFAKYKDEEPALGRETPGFKVPPMYKIEFLYVDLRPGTDAHKYYHAWAQAIQAMAPAHHFAEVVDTYQQLRNTRYRSVQPYVIMEAGVNVPNAPYYSLPLPPGPLSTAVRVEQRSGAQYAANLAAAVAQGPFTPFAALTVVQPVSERFPREKVEAMDLADAVGRVAALSAGGYGWPAVAAPPPRYVSSETFEPLAKVFEQIAADLTDKLARDVLEADFAKLEKELSEYSRIYLRDYNRARTRSKDAQGKPLHFTPPPIGEKKEKFEEYIQRWASARGMLYERMAEPRSRLDFFKEEGKTPLGTFVKPLFYKLEQQINPSLAADDQRFLEQMVDALVGPTITDINPITLQPERQAYPLYEMRRLIAPSRRFSQLAGNPQFLRHITDKNEQIVSWKTYEQDARVPTFEEARPRVVEAWRLLKAREAAKARAEAYLKAVLASKPDGYRTLKDLPGYHDDQELARFKLQPPLGTSPFVEYLPAPIPVLDSPPDDLLDTALAALKEPGDAILVANKPKSHYYLIVLKKREQPRATDSTSAFDFDVMTWDRQIRIRGQRLAEFVMQERADEFRKKWEEYLHARTHFNKEHAKELADYFRNRRSG